MKTNENMCIYNNVVIPSTQCEGFAFTNNIMTFKHTLECYQSIFIIRKWPLKIILWKCLMVMIDFCHKNRMGRNNGKVLLDEKLDILVRGNPWNWVFDQIEMVSITHIWKKTMNLAHVPIKWNRQIWVIGNIAYSSLVQNTSM